MNSSSSQIPVRRTTTFTRQLEQLARKYRTLTGDVESLLVRLSRKRKVGEQMPSIDGHALFKVKIAADGLEASAEARA